MRVAFKISPRDGETWTLVEYILSGYSGAYVYPRDNRRKCVPFFLTYSVVGQYPYWLIEKTLYLTRIGALRNVDFLRTLPIGEYALLSQSLLGGKMGLEEEKYSPQGVHRGHFSVRKLLREMTLSELERNYFIVDLDDPLPLLSMFRGISRFDLAWARVVASYKLAEIVSGAVTSEEAKESFYRSLAALVFDLLAKLSLGAVLTHYWSEYAYAMWLGDVRGLVHELAKEGFHTNLSLAEYLVSRDFYLECLKASKSLVDVFVRAADGLRRGSISLADFCREVRRALDNLNDYTVAPVSGAMRFLYGAVNVDCNYVKSTIDRLPIAPKDSVSVYGVTERSSPLPFALMDVLLRRHNRGVKIVLVYTVNTYDRLLLINHFVKSSGGKLVSLETLPVSSWNVYTTYVTLKKFLYDSGYQGVVAYSKTTSPATVLYALLKLKFRDGIYVDIALGRQI